MTTFKLSSAALATTLALGSVALPQAAQAGRTITPATACQPHAGSANDAEFLQYSINGRVFNAHPNKRLAVVCPITRHNQSNSANWIRVYYDDNNATGGTNGRLGCRLRSNNAFGTNAADYSPKYQTSAAGGTYDGYFHFTGVTAANNSPSYPYNYVLVCELPTKSGSSTSSIGSIVMDEPN